MKWRVIAALILLSFPAKSQDAKQELLEQINRDIWKPFIEGVNTNNAGQYNGVNAKDFYWVQGGSKTRIMNLQEYTEDARVVMQGRVDKGIKTVLGIRFLERNINAEFASEKCVINYTSVSPGKEAVTSYGVMQVFSRREGGIWKKSVQYVHPEPATAGIFESAASM